MKGETCATPINIFRRDPAPMRFDDRADNCQAHTQSFLFCGEKLLEEPVACYSRNPTPMVAHSHANRPVAIGARGNLHRSRRGGGVSCIASNALRTRLIRTCWICVGSPSIAGRLSARDKSSLQNCAAASGRTRWLIVFTTSFKFIRPRIALPFLIALRTLWMMSCARPASLTISVRISPTCPGWRLPCCDVLHGCAGVVHNRGERLIKFVRERRRHFAE